MAEQLWHGALAAGHLVYDYPMPAAYAYAAAVGSLAVPHYFPNITTIRTPIDHNPINWTDFENTFPYPQPRIMDPNNTVLETIWRGVEISTSKKMPRNVEECEDLDQQINGYLRVRQGFESGYINHVNCTDRYGSYPSGHWVASDFRVLPSWLHSWLQGLNDPEPKPKDKGLHAGAGDSSTGGKDVMTAVVSGNGSGDETTSRASGWWNPFFWGRETTSSNKSSTSGPTSNPPTSNPPTSNPPTSNHTQGVHKRTSIVTFNLPSLSLATFQRAFEILRDDPWGLIKNDVVSFASEMLRASQVFCDSPWKFARDGFANVVFHTITRFPGWPPRTKAAMCRKLMATIFTPHLFVDACSRHVRGNIRNAALKRALRQYPSPALRDWVPDQMVALFQDIRAVVTIIIRSVDKFLPTRLRSIIGHEYLDLHLRLISNWKKWRLAEIFSIPRSHNKITRSVLIITATIIVHSFPVVYFRLNHKKDLARSLLLAFTVWAGRGLYANLGGFCFFDITPCVIGILASEYHYSSAPYSLRQFVVQEILAYIRQSRRIVVLVDVFSVWVMYYFHTPAEKCPHPNSQVTLFSIFSWISTYYSTRFLAWWFEIIDYGQLLKLSAPPGRNYSAILLYRLAPLVITLLVFAFWTWFYGYLCVKWEIMIAAAYFGARFACLRPAPPLNDVSTLEQICTRPLELAYNLYEQLREVQEGSVGRRFIRLQWVSWLFFTAYAIIFFPWIWFFAARTGDIEKCPNIDIDRGPGIVILISVPIGLWILERYCHDFPEGHANRKLIVPLKFYWWRVSLATVAVGAIWATVWWICDQDTPLVILTALLWSLVGWRVTKTAVTSHGLVDLPDGKKAHLFTVTLPADGSDINIDVNHLPGIQHQPVPEGFNIEDAMVIDANSGQHVTVTAPGQLDVVETPVHTADAGNVGGGDGGGGGGTSGSSRQVDDGGRDGGLKTYESNAGGVLTPPKLPPNHREPSLQELNEFVSFTGTDLELARTILELAGGDILRATEIFFEREQYGPFPYKRCEICNSRPDIRDWHSHPTSQQHIKNIERRKREKPDGVRKPINDELNNIVARAPIEAADLPRESPRRKKENKKPVRLTDSAYECGWTRLTRDERKKRASEDLHLPGWVCRTPTPIPSSALARPSGWAYCEICDRICPKIAHGARFHHNQSERSQVIEAEYERERPRVQKETDSVDGGISGRPLKWTYRCKICGLLFCDSSIVRQSAGAQIDWEQHRKLRIHLQQTIGRTKVNGQGYCCVCDEVFPLASLNDIEQLDAHLDSENHRQLEVKMREGDISQQNVFCEWCNRTVAVDEFPDHAISREHRQKRIELGEEEVVAEKGVAEVTEVTEVVERIEEVEMQR